MEFDGSKTKEYPHLGEVEVSSISGFYRIEKEELISVKGRTVLCEIGYGVVDSSCCGVGGCRFAHVAGYVRQYRLRRDSLGRWISEVEPIQDANVRRELEELLKENEMVQQVLWEA